MRASSKKVKRRLTKTYKQEGHKDVAGRRVVLQKEGERKRGRLERKWLKRDPWCEKQRRTKK